MTNTLREAVFRYIKRKYKREREYLWERFPGYAVFRHPDNRKWFALVADISRGKLGLPGEETVDVLNVKLDSPLLTDLLMQQDGYFPCSHFSRGGWVSVLLDGTVPEKKVFGLIDISYQATMSRQRKRNVSSS